MSSITHNGVDYLFYHSARKWSSARALCGEGYDLANIFTADDNYFVASQIAQHGGGEWWIGYTDQWSETSWVWDFDRPFSGPVYWRAGEPNNWGGNEDCATISSTDGKWNDADCSRNLRFVCSRHFGGLLQPERVHGYNATNTNNATQNYAQFAVNLTAHKGVTFGTCGVEQSAAAGNTYLRLFAPNNTTELAFNNDACDTLASNISYAPSVGGTYYIHAGCYGNASCSGAIAVRQDPASPGGF